VLRLELTKTKQRGELFRFDGKALVEEQVVTQGTLQAVLGKS
jgi:3-hydroxymyristoyl/3-hydroxydecanoyl-(acyl carrier protein) dehydratase